MSEIILFLILCIISPFMFVCCQRGRIHPEYDLTLEQRVRRHGYPIEAHQVETEDDYLISVYRIPHGLKRGENETKNKSIVLILHGMGGAPHNFIVLGRERGAPYYFADMGMDVWLFCARGSEGSFKKKHKKLDWDRDPQFWLHSLHEIGKYDLSATIDYVLETTGQSKLSLIGHSAGGNEFFCLFSEKPEYTAKVKLGVNWGSSPIIMGMHYPLILFFCEIVDVLKGLVALLGMAEFFPIVHSLKPTLNLFCADPDWQMACITLTWVIGSHKSVLQRPDDIQLLFSNIPRLSSRQVLHFLDNIKHGKFMQYDHGPKGNMKRYGQKQPPEYNLTAANVPVAFFIGPNDSEITREDVQAAIDQIPNPILLHEVAFPKFTHLDFIFGQNATELVYEPTYKLMKDIDAGVVYPPILKTSSN